MAKTNAMERYADPIEVAEVIVFMSSERASFVTGGPFFVDGGATLRSPTGDALKAFTTGKRDSVMIHECDTEGG
jgi:hypothetical protein